MEKMWQHVKYAATAYSRKADVPRGKAAPFMPAHGHTHYYNHLKNGLFSRTTWVSRYQKSKTNMDFTGARDSEWQWHQLSHMQVCTSLQRDNHASTPPLCFLQAGCPSCHPTNSVKAMKALQGIDITHQQIIQSDTLF